VCCRVDRPKNAFFGRKTCSSGVLSRFFVENRVYPACNRVFQAKNAFIGRKSRSSGVWSRFSGENRVYPPKIVFFD